MKRIQVFLFIVVAGFNTKAQIAMQTNLPKTVPLNSEVSFDVKINKGSTTNFAKYQIEVPRGSEIQEVESQSGSFSVEENVGKIIWVIAPQQEEFTVSFKLKTGSMAGNKVVKQKYFFIENDNNREMEMEPVALTYRDSSFTGAFVSTSEFIPVSAKPLTTLLTTTINAAEISTKNPKLLMQQVIQLRKDAKDAAEVGEREKKKAEEKIKEAEATITAAELLTEETEKQAALDKGNKAKAKAEEDLAVAERVLTLAKSLEDNANEIETINRSVNPDSYFAKGTDPLISSNNKKKANTENETAVHVNLDEETGTDASDAQNEQNKTSDKQEVETGLVYKIQLGAFSKEPSRRDFKSLGKVVITQENGMYKVLYGSYDSKKEAFKQRERIISKGFDGFVVSYQDGVRVN